MSAETAVTRPDGTRQGWLRAAALALIVAAIGLPLNSLGGYVLAAVAALAIFTGIVVCRPVLWIAATLAVAVSLLSSALIAPPKIDEGHNVFLPSPTLEAGLPPDVYRYMRAAFDAQYPADKRCEVRQPGCWLQNKMPDTTFGFSADGVLDKSPLSRRVATLGFGDPVWLGLGFVNEIGYNWYDTISDVKRADRDRRFWKGLDRWQLLMPWFETVRFPAAYLGGKLCWRGDTLWPNASGGYDAVSHAAENCRTLAAQDIGRDIFGIAIKPETLAMRVESPAGVTLLRLVVTAIKIAAVLAVVGLLVRAWPSRWVLPGLLIAASLLIVVGDDASLIGGLRPFDGGDDGLFYDGVGRNILRFALAGDWYKAFEGGESVYYYGGPGLRYFRALEHLLFGETVLGYLTLMLLFPLALLGVFQRFISMRWAIFFAVVFVAIPAGAFYGTSYFHYIRYATRGFADPACYALFIFALLPIAGATAAGPGNRFAPAFFGALLVALALFMRPIVAPACAVLLGGAALFALSQRRWRSVAGLCLGFAPALVMPLHNWIYGGVFVLFSANAAHPQVLTLPPAAYLDALRELAGFDFSGGMARRAVAQIMGWLKGPGENAAMVPVHAAAIAILIYVAAFGRRLDPWLRLLAGTALAQHVIALFYVAVARYHFLAWLLTLIVTAAWLESIGLGLLQRRFPRLFSRVLQASPTRRLASALEALQKMQTGKVTRGPSL